MASDDSDESDKEESEKLVFESVLAGTFSTVLGILLRVLVFPFGVTLSSDESFYGN